MPFLELTGARLYYEVSGSGPPIVFAHGLSGNHLSWWQQLPSFRTSHTCVTYAHRGWPPSTGTPQLATLPEDLARLIDHLELEDVTLVAQSMGGFACLPFALAHPTKVKALVLSSTTGPLPTGPYRGAGAPLPDLRARGINAAAGERMAREQPELHELYTMIDRLSATAERQQVVAQFGSLIALQVDQVATLACPVLWIGGGEDAFDAAEARAAALRELLPHWQLRVVPNAGHSVYFERAATFNALVLEFLAAVA